MEEIMDFYTHDELAPQCCLRHSFRTVFFSRPMIIASKVEQEYDIKTPKGFQSWYNWALKRIAEHKFA
jgi:hypothetical protein